jgi:hypothetical protein
MVWSVVVAFLMCAAIVGGQIVSGRLLNRAWQVSATRQESPRQFWLGIALQAAILLTAAVICALVLVGVIQ